MKTVPVSGLEPGMVLGRPITTIAGQTLVPQGTVLTESLCARLTGREDVDAVYVQEPEDGAPGADTDPAEVKAEIDRMFGSLVDEPVMGLLHRLACKHAGVGDV